VASEVGKDSGGPTGRFRRARRQSPRTLRSASQAPPRPAPARAGLLALLACALAFAWTLQGTGFNQNSHYALVRALANGTPQIDRTRHEVGDLSTEDVIHLDGHVYANKAPGLAFATLPLYLALDAAGLVGDGDPTRVLWALGLVGCVLPAVLLLGLLRWAANRIEPGFGTAAAVAIGLGTLILPFATLFFSHALSAFLVFAAFALLLLERGGAPRSGLVAAAGIVAGLSIVTEYPNGLAALVLAVYAAWRARPVRRLLAFGAGGLVGLVPLLLYNWWAFGNPVHLSYVGESPRTGQIERPAGELVGSAGPTVVRVLETLFSTSGLLTLAPVLACAAVATVLLFRAGRRAEALVVAGVSALYVVYNSSYASNFGGFSAGQRYVIPIIPFLGLPLAVAFRRFPATTAALALVSVIVATATTATSALAGYDLDWFGRIGRRTFTYTPGLLADVTGWYTILPFFGAAAAAAVLAGLATAPVRVRGWDVAAAGAAVLGWAIVAAEAPKTPALGGDADTYGAYAAAGLVLLVLALAAASATLMVRGRTPPFRDASVDRARA
jgi:hypothetical protein